MDNKKVIIFGNGIEAHFNQQLKNFNNDIKQWIKELNQSPNLRDSLFNQFKTSSGNYLGDGFSPETIWGVNQQGQNLSRKTNKNSEETFWKEVKDNNYLGKILRLLEKELNKNSNVTIEDALKNVGDSLIQLFDKGTSTNHEVSAIFTLLKIILGHYIENVCKHGDKVNNAINILKSPNFNWEILQPLQDYGYDKIYTTNYSNFVNVFINQWQTNKSLGIYDVKNIHGEYFSKPKNYFERYNSLQINLSTKKSKELIAPDFNRNKIYFDSYSLELYGLDIKNDEITLTEIIELMIMERLNYHATNGTLFSQPNNLNIEIIYNYFEKNKNIPELIQKSVLMSLCKSSKYESDSIETSFVKKENDSFIYKVTINSKNVLTVNFSIILKDVKNHDIFKAMNLISNNDSNYYYNNNPWLLN